MSLVKRILDAVAGQERRGGRNWRVGKIAGGAMLAASLLFLIYAVYAGRDTLLVYSRHLNWWLLAAALLLYPLGFVPVLWGWHVTMGRIGGCQDMRANVRLYSLSCLPKRIPGSIWYIASRVALYREHHVGSTITLAATAMETVLLILSGLSIYLLSLAVRPVELDPRLSGVAIVCFMLVLAAPKWAPLLHRGLRQLLARMGTPIPVELHPTDVLRLLGISGLAWVGGGLVLYILANAVTTVPLGDLPILVGDWGAAGAIGLTAGLLVHGMGLREVTLAVLLSSYMPLSVAVVVSLLFRLLLTGGEFIWALIFAWLAARLPK